MLIGVVAETDPRETRVAASPETVKKFIALGAEVAVQRGAGIAAGVTDADYQTAGARLVQAAEAFGADILRLCVDVGGVLTGEHGVGVEKRDLMPVMFSEIDLNAQQRVKCAFDAKGLLNPGKVFPTLHRCAELGHLHVHAGRLPFPDIPRF